MGDQDKMTEAAKNSVDESPDRYVPIRERYGIELDEKSRRQRKRRNTPRIERDASYSWPERKAADLVNNVSAGVRNRDGENRGSTRFAEVVAMLFVPQAVLFWVAAIGYGIVSTVAQNGVTETFILLMVASVLGVMLTPAIGLPVHMVLRAIRQERYSLFLISGSVVGFGLGASRLIYIFYFPLWMSGAPLEPPGLFSLSAAGLIAGAWLSSGYWFFMVRER
ncbi:MAG: hypothetical protein CMK07_07960 [Ponticaulis sp.]|nr:hypothetical protein [Ponticaulis sp.]